MVYHESKRTFDGKQYNYVMKFFHKQELEEFKSRAKDRGFSVRVVTKYNKLDGGDYYLVYARQK